MVSNIQDQTYAFNLNGSGFKMDISGWENASVHFVGLAGTVSFFASNDAGAITGVSDGGAISSDNYVALAVATTAAPNTLITSGSASTVYILNPVGPIRAKFISVQGNDLSADKVLVFLSKPY